MKELEIIKTMLEKGANNAIFNQAEIYAINQCLEKIEENINEIQEATQQEADKPTD